jgi:hypothetical protein
MMNCNPETVSTDYDTSSRLYFEPITVEDVLNVIEVRHITLQQLQCQLRCLPQSCKCSCLCCLRLTWRNRHTCGTCVHTGYACMPCTEQSAAH